MKFTLAERHARVSKRRCRLEVVEAGRVLFACRVAIGPRQGPKRREGDRCTPEGSYRLDPARPSEAGYHLFMPNDYPNEADRAGRSEAPLGGDIGLHGTGPGWPRMRHFFHLRWTQGCIAVTDRQIESIAALVDRPAPIVIEP